MQFILLCFTSLKLWGRGLALMTFGITEGYGGHLPLQLRSNRIFINSSVATACGGF